MRIKNISFLNNFNPKQLRLFLGKRWLQERDIYFIPAETFK